MSFVVNFTKRVRTRRYGPGVVVKHTRYVLNYGTPKQANGARNFSTRRRRDRLAVRS